MIKHLLFLVLISFLCQGFTKDRMVMNFNPYPMSENDTNEISDNLPSIEFFPVPDSINTGICVLICPGGGYTHLAYKKEGIDVAKLLNQSGIQAFVLNYRCNDKLNEKKHHYPASFNDVSTAMRIIRKNSSKWNIDTQKTGVMGFSAGGHLAATLANQNDTGDHNADHELLKYSSRPDFAILIYPVITFTNENYVHKGSRKNLLGENRSKSEEWKTKLSQELQVNTNTPPVFLLHADDDHAVKPENSVLFYMALKSFDIPATLHILPKGGHGFGLAPNNKHLSKWPELLIHWLLQYK